MCISEVIEISPAILIPTCALSSPAFLMMYSAYNLNKQGNNIQPWCTPFPVLNCCSMSSLTIASSPAYRFFRRQVRWSGIPISWRIFYNLLWSTQSRLWHSQWSRSRCFSVHTLTPGGGVMKSQILALLLAVLPSTSSCYFLSLQNPAHIPQTLGTRSIGWE